MKTVDPKCFSIAVFFVADSMSPEHPRFERTCADLAWEIQKAIEEFLSEPVAAGDALERASESC